MLPSPINLTEKKKEQKKRVKQQQGRGIDSKVKKMKHMTPKGITIFNKNSRIGTANM